MITLLLIVASKITKNPYLVVEHIPFSLLADTMILAIVILMIAGYFGVIE